MRLGRRVRLALAGVVALLLAGAGLWWGWGRWTDRSLARGLEAYAQGYWQRAESSARERLKRAPNDRSAVQLLARSSARLGQDETAQALYRQLYQQGGGSDPLQAEDYFLLAAGLLRQKQIDPARGALEIALKLDPHHPEALLQSAQLYEDDGRLDEAIGLAEQLAGVPGWEARGGVMLALLRQKQHNPRGVAVALSEALKHDATLRGADLTPNAAHKLLARAFLATEQPLAAKTLLQPVRSSRADPELSWLLSRALLQTGETAEAEKALSASGRYAQNGGLERAEPSPYIGAARCAQCHPTQYGTQQTSRHAKTFHRGNELQALALPDRPVADPGNSRVRHTLSRQGDRVRLTTAIDANESSALVDYAFGSGDRGLTLVGRDQSGQARELRLSFYRDLSGWDRTTGQRPVPAQPGDYLGKPLAGKEVRLCLECHTTSAWAAREQAGPVAADHAIGCERCHGPGGNHVLAVESDFPDLAIARPKLASGAEVVKLCAECHNPRQGTFSPSDKKVVRFQAATLTWSRCYTESRGALSCVTCHNPHRNAESSPAFYEAKCLACHSESAPGGDAHDGTRPIHLPSEVRRAVCPVNPARDCIKCHMPTVPDAVPHSPFADHQIRIHHSGSGTLPRRSQ